MTTRRKAPTFVALGALMLLTSAVIVSRAEAHGSSSNPISRTQACFLEGPESPRSAACIAAVAAGGTQALYDWHEVNIADAAGRHRALIPDGKLCSAGRDKYRGFDLARADWPATTLRAGAAHTFTYRATAPHRGSFEFYVTRNGYDPTQPLRWADLEGPFLRATDPALTDGAYVMSGTLPAGKQGRHVIYSIWQRSDSPEAFYACSDVDFGGGTAPTTGPSTSTTTTTRPVSTTTARPTTSTTAATTPTTATTTRPTTSTTTPSGAIREWTPWTRYAAGTLVTYEGRTYRCWQAHTSQPDWAPTATPALWQAR